MTSALAHSFLSALFEVGIQILWPDEDPPTQTHHSDFRHRSKGEVPPDSSTSLSNLLEIE
jgi:hypothetical protein